MDLSASAIRLTSSLGPTVHHDVAEDAKSRSSAAASCDISPSQRHIRNASAGLVPLGPLCPLRPAARGRRPIISRLRMTLSRARTHRTHGCIARTAATRARMAASRARPHRAHGRIARTAASHARPHRTQCSPTRDAVITRSTTRGKRNQPNNPGLIRSSES